jgi:lipopolysaccharide export system permease protein
LVVEKALPPATKAYRRLANDIGFLGMVPQFKSNVMMSINQYSARFGSVQRGKEGMVLLRDVLLIEEPRPNEMTITRAPSGTFHDGIWRIQAAKIFYFKGTGLHTTETKGEVVINDPIRIADLFMPVQPTELSAADLLVAIKSNREAHLSTTANEVAYHQKYSGPAACLVFAFTGAVLAVRFAKAGPFIGVMVSLGLVWLHFNAYVISGEVLGKNGWIPPVGAAWLPNVLFFVVGLFFVRRLE